jgi:thioesterase domain-containing protein
VLLRKGISNRHIFFIHDGSGGIEAYAKMAEHLNAEYNCWGIMSERFDDVNPELTIEDVAMKYLNKIRKVHPEGTVNIAGWSIGGTIVFEIARLLELSGEETGILALIDSKPPKSKSTGHDGYSDELDRLAGEIDEINLKDLSDIELNKLIPENFVKVIPGFQKMDKKDILNFFYSMRTYSKAALKYQPSNKIKTQVHYVKANRSVIDDENTWNLHTENKVKFYRMEGDHFSIFEKPNIDELVEIFNGIMS